MSMTAIRESSAVSECLYISLILKSEWNQNSNENYCQYN